MYLKHTGYNLFASASRYQVINYIPNYPLAPALKLNVKCDQLSTRWHRILLVVEFNIYLSLEYMYLFSILI